ncbi:MAG: hypothetical protein ACYTEL_22325, partial [Planctomycetota bacterium]
RGRLTNPVGPKAYEGNAAFSLSRKRTQTARKKTFFTKRTQVFLVLKDHKSFFCKGLRRQGRIFAIKKTNPNEPKPVRQKDFFYETDPNLLGIQRSQILFVQRFTKARLHFRYQENEPKRTQLQPVPASIPARRGCRWQHRLLLRSSVIRHLSSVLCRLSSVF